MVGFSIRGPNMNLSSAAGEETERERSYRRGEGDRSEELHTSSPTMETMDPTREFVRGVKRIVVKVGTVVVARADGRLALGRLGSLCEQVKELNSLGFEVVLVTSGAVGVGRQRLGYRKLVHSSFADLEKPRPELDGKACAAVGQAGLMALYDALFTQLDVSSAQLVVTHDDFKNHDFTGQLRETVESLLATRVVPIFNENDAISTRQAAYEDSSVTFWDNDGLAALLALELKADLLVLLSNVDGLYSGPPGEPQSKLIHTYIPEIHEAEITFGNKSNVGRGGMTAKVKSAIHAAEKGTPAIITSGFTTDNILRALEGERVGTLFHKDSHMWAQSHVDSAQEMTVAAKECSRRLQGLSTDERRKILLDIADALEANEEYIRMENDADGVSAPVQNGTEWRSVSRRTLNAGKISSLANSIRKIADKEDPIGQVFERREVCLYISLYNIKKAFDCLMM